MGNIFPANISGASIGDLKDVDITTVPPVPTNSLVFNGSEWVPGVGGGTAPVDSVNGQTGHVVLTTADITEVTNLYYTDTRVTSLLGLSSIDVLSDVDTVSVVPVIGNALLWDGANWAPGTSSSPVDSVNGQTGAVVLSTTDINEGSNLYYTDTRVTSLLGLSSIDVLSDVDTVSVVPVIGNALLWDGANWAPGTSSSPVDSVNGQTGAVVLSTTDINEGSNLYYTDTRVTSLLADTSISALSDVDTSSVPFSAGEPLVWSGSIWRPLSVGPTLLLLKKQVTFGGGVGGLANFRDANDIPQITLGTSLTSGNISFPVLGHISGDVRFFDQIRDAVGSPGLAGQLLSSTGAGISWVAAPSGGVDSVNGSTGVVLLDTSDIPEVTNLYYTDTRVTTLLGVTSIDALSDVDTATFPPADGSLLAFDSTAGKWFPANSSFASSISVPTAISFSGASGSDVSFLDSLNALQLTIQALTGEVVFISSSLRHTGSVKFDSSVEFTSTLLDINAESGTPGQLLSSTGTGIDWIDAPSGGAVDSVNGQTGVVDLGIGDLNDVDISTTAPSAGELLAWNASNSMYETVSNTSTLLVSVPRPVAFGGTGSNAFLLLRDTALNPRLQFSVTGSGSQMHATLGTCSMVGGFSFTGGFTAIGAGLLDRTGSAGAAGSVLTSTGSQVEWLPTLPTASLTKNAPQVITSSTPTAVLLQTISINQPGYIVGTPTNGITVLQNGTYKIEGRATFRQGSLVSNSIVETAITWNGAIQTKSKANGFLSNASAVGLSEGFCTVISSITLPLLANETIGFMASNLGGISSTIDTNRADLTVTKIN